MKKLYGGIDLHGHNSVVVVLDEADQVLYQKRLPNELAKILPQLAPFRTQLQGLVVESTYNWYWLVDGLQEAGYVVHLANPAAMQQYAGLKYTNDDSDARWLAHLLRLGVLPTGYIYPKEDRAIRDLLRKRSQLVPSEDGEPPEPAKLTDPEHGTGHAGQSDQATHPGDHRPVGFASGTRAGLAGDRGGDAAPHGTDYPGRTGGACACEAAAGISGAVDGPRHWPDAGSDDHAGDRRDSPLPHRGAVCLLLPVRGEYQAEQWQTQGPGQHEEWQ